MRPLPRANPALIDAKPAHGLNALYLGQSLRFIYFEHRDKHYKCLIYKKRTTSRLLNSGQVLFRAKIVDVESAFVVKLNFELFFGLSIDDAVDRILASDVFRCGSLLSQSLL